MTMTEERPADTSGLPPGVVREGNKFYRTKNKMVRTQDGLFYRPEKREVALVSQFDSEEDIHKAREAAARKGLDFYDPRESEDHPGIVIGWLDRGRKREEEWPANCGSGQVNNAALIPIPDDENPDLAVFGHGRQAIARSEAKAKRRRTPRAQHQPEEAETGDTDGE